MHLRFKVRSTGLSKISIRKYAIFTMYSAPWIDLMNGAIGGLFPIGQIVRTIIVLINLSICMLWLKRVDKKIAVSVYISFVYIILHAFIISMASSTSLMAELSFGMKLMLMLSEILLLTRCVERNKMNVCDFECFWKFSCWFVPISIIVSKLLHLTNYDSNSNAGLYSSVNAMSIILIVQFALSIHYARRNMEYWVVLLLNIVAVVLLGTKSPYLYMMAIVAALLLFYSKHRVRMMFAIAAGGIAAYLIITHFFANELARILDYQLTHFSEARMNNRVMAYLFSGRNDMLIRAWDGLKGNNMQVIATLFGVGRGNFPNGIEMDFFEIVLAFGIIVALAVYYLVLVPFSWKCRNRKVYMDKALFINIALVCVVSFSTLGGHTFLEAIAATYAAILVGYKYGIAKAEIPVNLRSDLTTCEREDLEKCTS